MAGRARCRHRLRRARASVRDECMALLAHRGVMVSVAHGEGLTIKDLYRRLRVPGDDADRQRILRLSTNWQTTWRCCWKTAPI